MVSARLRGESQARVLNLSSLSLANVFPWTPSDNICNKGNWEGREEEKRKQDTEKVRERRRKRNPPQILKNNLGKTCLVTLS